MTGSIMTPTTRRLFLSTFLALLLQSSLPSVTEAFSLKMNSYLDNLGRNNHHPNRGSSSEDGASPAHQQQRGSQSQQQQQEQGYSPGFGMPPVNMPPMPPPQQQQQPLKDIDNIFRQNQVWKGSKLNEDPNFFQTLGSNHKPTYMWIGCADARVPANEIMGEDAGAVFVVRNVANMVVNTDFNLMSALQFAVDTLKIPHIIVCGHYDCGGIRASMQKKDHVPPLENWLRNIRDVYRLHKDELDSIGDPEARHRRLVELNVIEQVLNLFKTGVVQRRRVTTYKEGKSYTTPRIHAAVFDPKTGDMNRLPVNFKEYINELHDIYDLYTVEGDEVALNVPHAPQQLGNPHSPQQSRDQHDGSIPQSPSISSLGDTRSFSSVEGDAPLQLENPHSPQTAIDQHGGSITQGSSFSSHWDSASFSPLADDLSFQDQRNYASQYIPLEKAREAHDFDPFSAY